MTIRPFRGPSAQRALDLDAVPYYEGLGCVGMLIEAGEHIQARAGVIAPIAKPTAFTDSRTIVRLVARFRAVSGITATIGPTPCTRSQ